MDSNSRGKTDLSNLAENSHRNEDNWTDSVIVFSVSNNIDKSIRLE